MAACKIDPTAQLSESGLPLIPRCWIADLEPAKVSECLYDALLSAVMRDKAEWDLVATRLHALPQRWRLIYSICCLQAQVDNGGHDQFFSNGRGEFDDEVEADLRLIGAEDFLRLFVEARRLYYSVPPNQMERIPELYPLDDAFYKQEKSLFVLVGEHVLAHLTEYCAD